MTTLPNCVISTNVNFSITLVIVLLLIAVSYVDCSGVVFVCLYAGWHDVCSEKTDRRDSMVVKGRWELISHDRVVLLSEVCPTYDHLSAEVRKIYREKLFRCKSLAIKNTELGFGIGLVLVLQRWLLKSCSLISPYYTKFQGYKLSPDIT